MSSHSHSPSFSLSSTQSPSPSPYPTWSTETFNPLPNPRPRSSSPYDASAEPENKTPRANRSRAPSPTSPARSTSLAKDGVREEEDCVGSPKLLYRKAFYEFEMDEGKRGVWKGKDGVEGRVKESAGSTRRTVTREEVLFRAEKLVAKSKPGFSTWGNEASPTPSPSPARGRRQARQSPPIRRSARMGQNSSPSRNAPIKTEGETRESATAIAAVEGDGESVASNVTLGREVEAEARSAISVASSRTLGRSDESAVSSAALGRANVVSSATVRARSVGPDRDSGSDGESDGTEGTGDVFARAYHED